jgi:hypothetical protein
VKRKKKTGYKKCASWVKDGRRDRIHDEKLGGICY